MPKPLIGITTERRPALPGRPDVLLHALLPSYVEAVRGAGGVPVLIPLTLAEAELSELYLRLDGVLVPGGGDIDPQVYGAPLHPATNTVDVDRDGLEIYLARRAAADHKPFLGICRGVQVFNVALGGSLYQDLPTEYPGTLGHMFRTTEYASDYLAHPVKVEEASLLARILGAPIVEVNSRHHQALKDVAPSLEVVARAPDQVIEAVELKSHPFALGVQWHPENLQQHPAMKALFDRFVEAAQQK